MAALIIAIFPQNSSRGNWEEQQDRTDPNSQFELARKPAWLLAFRQFGLPKWKHDFESFPPCDFWWKLSEDGSTQRKPKSCGIVACVKRLGVSRMMSWGLPPWIALLVQ